MTTMPTEMPGLPRGRTLVRDDLDAMPDDGHRYELLDGILIVSPAPRINHQRAIGQLFLALRAACPPELEVLFAPLDVVLAEDTVLQPDLLVAPRTAFTERDLPTAPLLAIEVLSPSTRGVDLLLKKDRLRRAECAHYWVVDPDEPSITAWTLRDGEYCTIGAAVGAQELLVDDPFVVRVVPSALLG
ncbi:Uma2 family endonuclease [Gordonia sp. TBRC 11910]|uniref:Uma2 family endonuclease n=1 Tax=Gordonia asplenii TaxID=2725283 RepID=A0A848KPE6_9ACTN|nr:Uma2 family endonuclease [Gordonia asplenii]NMO00914.1 Uma2 family endonuclease [Gordonia asplenii]